MQEGVGSNCDELESIFKTRLESINRVVIMLDTFSKPTYLTRIWCVFETFTAYKFGIQMDITLPKSEDEKFTEALEGNRIKSIREGLRTVDAEQATASVKADEDHVKRLIREDNTIGGFRAVNEAVAEIMLGWVKTRFDDYMKAPIHLQVDSEERSVVGCVIGSVTDIDSGRPSLPVVPTTTIPV